MTEEESVEHTYAAWLSRAMIAAKVLAESLRRLDTHLVEAQLSRETADMAREVFTEHLLEAIIPLQD